LVAIFISFQALDFRRNEGGSIVKEAKTRLPHEQVSIFVLKQALVSYPGRSYTSI
jgi:hypothetical protein